jgi:hypothetical protein
VLQFADINGAVVLMLTLSSNAPLPARSHRPQRLQINSKYHSVSFRDGLSPNEKTQQLADKWRQERNFWIATMCLLLWIVLSRFYVLNKHNLALRDQVSSLGVQPHSETALPEDAKTPSAPSIPSTSKKAT